MSETPRDSHPGGNAPHALQAVHDAWLVGASLWAGELWLTRDAGMSVDAAPAVLNLLGYVALLVGAAWIGRVAVGRRRPLFPRAFVAMLALAAWAVAFLLTGLTPLPEPTVAAVTGATVAAAAAAAWCVAPLLRRDGVFAAAVLACAGVLTWAGPYETAAQRASGLTIMQYVLGLSPLLHVAIAVVLAAPVAAGVAWALRGGVAWIAALATLVGASAVMVPMPERVAAPEPRTHGAPQDVRNVLVVSIDSLRFDELTSGGAREAVVPHVDGLAEQSTFFHRAYSPSVMTLPALTSIFTGLPLDAHAMGFFYTARDYEALDETLPYRTSELGWRTALFMGRRGVRMGGMGRAFDHYDTGGGSEPYRCIGTRAARYYAGYEAGQVPPHVLHAQMRAWVESDPERPFFAWLHDLTPHFPYTVAAQNGPTRFAGSAGERAALSRNWLYRDVSGGIDPIEQARLRAAYRDELAAADEALGATLRWLDASGLAERTIVVVTADHGEFLGDRGATTHGQGFFDECIRVPLLIRDPDRPGRSDVTTAVSLLDLWPTLIEMAGGEPPEVHSSRSFVAPGGGPVPERPVFCESVNGTAVVWRDVKVVRVAEDRLDRLGTRDLCHRSPVEAYDLTADPREERDISGSLPDLDAYLRLMDAFRAGEGPVVAPPHLGADRPR